MFLDRARSANSINFERLIDQTILVRRFKFATTNSQLVPGMKESYPLLPFRALEEISLPAAIQQRWEASLAASKSAEWRMWFKALNPEQQKTHLEILSKYTRDKFWAALWLELKERSEPGHTRLIAAAVRALVILNQASLRKQMRAAQKSAVMRMEALRTRAKILEASGLVEVKTDSEDLPGTSPNPLSAPPTIHEIHSLQLRLSPSYFRLPTNAFRFATQIFSGKSYEEAVAEQKANFNSWIKESKVRRIEGHPDFVV